MKKLLQILFWSVISAAFIGPGTVTTAASAGASYGYSLLWALLFSTFATVVLQEAAARITVLTGNNLGQSIRNQNDGKKFQHIVLILVLGAIIFGCAAYEAGNILGGVAGAVLGTGLSRNLLTVLISAISGILLFFGSTKHVARFLGIVVGIMGIAFLVTAFLLKPPLIELLRGLSIPQMPSGSGMLILGLVGTTVVPYNIFLGSGIAGGQKLSELRFGLSVAVILGGIISMGVLIVGTAISGQFSFDSLAGTLSSRLGGWAGIFFAIGLFAAGFSSAITAPLAAAITARSLFGKDNIDSWNENSWRYRVTWVSVLLTGFIFGMTDIQPIPAIIIAQALNGFLLPFVAVFLFVVINDSGLMGIKNINGKFSNISMSMVVFVTVLLGVTNIAKAVARTLNVQSPDEKLIFTFASVVTILLAVPVFRIIIRKRKSII